MARARGALKLTVPEETTTPLTRPDREGKALLGAMVPKAALYQFGELASSERKGNGELLREIVNEYFARKGRPRIA